MPAATVVIPTRNRRRELERAIASVRSQSLQDWELVVVDDASTDDTPGFLECLEDRRIRVQRLSEHSERSAARNCGLALASAPAVLFLDDDDELLAGALELLSHALAQHPVACAAVGAVLHDANGVRRRTSFPKRPHQLEVRMELLAGWVALGGQSLMRTALAKEVGGWPEGLSVAEDQELWLRLCGRGPVAIIPDAVLIHRPHGLQGDAPGFRDVERGVVARHLDETAGEDPRCRRAARAREHLREADITFQLGAYRKALVETLRGIAVAPFLLKSPLIGPGIAAGLCKAIVAGSLPRSTANRLRRLMQRWRSRKLTPPS